MRSGRFSRIKTWRSTNRVAIAAVAICAALLSACADTERFEDLWRQIPIQMARATQTDSYRQVFLLGKSDGVNYDNMNEKQRGEFDANMDRVFDHLIGPRNWQHMKNLYGVNTIREEIIKGDIYMEGLVSFSAYLDPMDHDFIVMEGSGRFFAVRDKTGNIMMSGDYHIVPQRYRIKDLSRGCIPLQANTYTTRIPGKPTYYNNAAIQYDLIIKNLANKDEAFSVDYNVLHQAFLDLDDDDTYEANELFAKLKLSGRHRQAKVLDLRGIGFIRKDYKFDAVTRSDAKKNADEDVSRSCTCGKDPC